jgi:hypothetical protein
VLVSAWIDHPVVLLAVGVFVGVISYAAAILLFWSASGRPRSAERMTLDALAQLRARFAGGKPRAVRA